MDRIDNQILHLLLDNARISLSEISSKVNLSVSAVSERLKKLENSEMIQQYTTILNPKAFHKDLTVIMLVTLNGFADDTEFTQYVLAEPAITEYYHIAGSYDCCLKIITENTSSLEQIFNKIRKCPSVVKTQSNMVLSTLKCNYSIEPPEAK
ncbi:MAG: Lrp/AsnC family transcriptional regulator [Firmicutes bacterium]|nr:Lrp/AsnC family transcriptional regulator [Bacillota bacterium]